MATTMPERPATRSVGPRPRPGPESTRWETFSWWFFRVSGVALIFLAIIHLVLMHVVNDVSATGYDFVAMRYANPFWRLYDLLLLTLALFHGLNGLRIILDDYIARRGARLAVQSLLFLVAITFWLLGTITIITFQPGAKSRQRAARSVRTLTILDAPAYVAVAEGRRYPMNYHKFDVVIVGAGGAGLMAAMQLAHNSSIAVISKLYPTRSHTGAAQGGVARRWATRKKTTGSGTCSTPSRVATTWWIRTPPRCWRARRSTRSTTWSTGACPSTAPTTARSTSGASAGTRATSARGRCAAPATPPTAPAT